MSRVIKFRAWDNGELLENITPVADIDNNAFPYLAIVVFEANGETDGIRQVDFIEQYTGLIDDNQKEIYEGDILEWYKVTGVKMTKAVEWSVATQAFTAGDYMLNGVMGLGCRVVGNIHENPELVKAA